MISSWSFSKKGQHALIFLLLLYRHLSEDPRGRWPRSWESFEIPIGSGTSRLSMPPAQHSHLIGSSSGFLSTDPPPLGTQRPLASPHEPILLPFSPFIRSFLPLPRAEDHFYCSTLVYPCVLFLVRPNPFFVTSSVVSTLSFFFCSPSIF